MNFDDSGNGPNCMHEQPGHKGVDPERHASPNGGRKLTIRFQLILAVNAVLAVFVTFFLIFDYRRDLAERLEDKRIALEEEATTLLPAVQQMQHHGRDSVQRYIDTVCGRMQDTKSPGHHIAVAIGNDSFQAISHHRASPEMLRAMKQAAASPDHQSRLGETEIVVGTSKQGDTIVYVSETVDNLYRSVVSEVVRRLTGFVVLAFVAAMVVNFALTRIATRPLRELVATVQRIGEGRVGVQSGAFGSVEFDYLSTEITAMSQALADADRNRKIQMTKAREIQQHLRPKETDVSGLSVAFLFQPADDIGGDYYDMLPLGDGTWLFCIADVTGHGIPAAMSAAMLKTLLVQAAAQFTSPAAMLEFINRRFSPVSLLGDFVSILLVRTTPRAGTLEYASAGHEPAWILSPTGATRELPATGMLVGIDENGRWEDVTLELAPDHRLLMVTDGVSETHNSDGVMFGRERLARLFADCQHLSVEQTIAHIGRAVADYGNGKPQDDDVTAVLLELTELTSPQDPLS